MRILSRWLAPALFAAGFGFSAMMPTPAHAQGDDLARVIVDVADVIFRSGQPYYRYNDRYGYGDRLIVVHDRYRGPVYYRQVPRHVDYRVGPPYGQAHGYWRDGRRWDGRRWHYRDDRDHRRWDNRVSWRERDRDWRHRKDKDNHGHAKRRHGHDD